MDAERKENRMSKAEALEELVRFIGSWTYGKERWFTQNGVWYDRYDGKYIDTQELVARVIKAITDEIAEQT